MGPVSLGSMKPSPLLLSPLVLLPLVLLSASPPEEDEEEPHAPEDEPLLESPPEADVGSAPVVVTLGPSVVVEGSGRVSDAVWESVGGSGEVRLLPLVLVLPPDPDSVPDSDTTGSQAAKPRPRPRVSHPCHFIVGSIGKSHRGRNTIGPEAGRTQVGTEQTPSVSSPAGAVPSSNHGMQDCSLSGQTSGPPTSQYGVQHHESPAQVAP